MRSAVVITLLLLPVSAAATSLRFYGHGGSPGDNFVFPDRVKILSEPPAAVNVGATDFTIEFWMRATTAENPNGALPCGFGIDWVNGNILIDRDRFSQGRKLGIALLGGRIAWGVSDEFFSDYTLCGSVEVLDDAWHHVAVDRREADGRMRIWVDGELDAEGPVAGGPAGDVSYPIGAVPTDSCSPDGGAGSSSCVNSDPYLVFGAEKHGFAGINYSGWLDEIRLSTVLRYSARFTKPSSPFVTDGSTAALYHLDEGTGFDVLEAGGSGDDGLMFFGGASPAGPLWSSATPFPPEIPVIGGMGAAVLALLLGRTGARRAAIARVGRRGTRPHQSDQPCPGASPARWRLLSSRGLRHTFVRVTKRVTGDWNG